MRGVVVLLEIALLIIIGQFLYAVAVLGPEPTLEVYLDVAAQIAGVLRG